MKQHAAQPTWYLVANAAKCHIFERPDARSPATLVWEEEEPRGRMHARDLETDQAGVIGDKYGDGVRHMDTGQQVKQRLESDRARTLVERLEKARSQGTFRRLVLIAEPGILGLLRDKLSHETRNLLAKSIGKNIAEKPTNAITPELDALDGVEHVNQPKRLRPRSQQETP
ncbi:MAG: host attachment protein [Planctomycetota bacterium]